MKPSVVLSLFALVALLCSGAVMAEMHSRVANQIERIGQQRYTFCLHSSGVPSGSTFTAVMYFSFLDAEGNSVEEPSFVLGFPNAEFQLIRAVAHGNAIVVHQGPSSYFNWDGEAYRTTAFSTGVVISEHQLVGVTLVVEAPEIITLSNADQYTCDGPVYFVDETNMPDEQVIQQLPNEVVLHSDILMGDVVSAVSAAEPSSASSLVLMPLYIISIAIVTFMSVACVIRICIARRLASNAPQPLPEDEEAMIPMGEAVEMPSAYPMHAQPIMTAAGVQYVLVPQEAAFAMPPQAVAPMFLYPGQFVAPPQASQQ